MDTMLVRFAVALLSVVLHEAAHAVVCRLRGLAVRGIVVTRKGSIGVRRERGTPLDNALIALAGPCVSIGLMLLMWGTLGGVVNAAIVLINLLPIPGSDGRAFVTAIRQMRTQIA